MARHSLAALSLSLTAIPAGACAQEASLNAGGRRYLGEPKNVRAVFARTGRVTVYDETVLLIEQLVGATIYEMFVKTTVGPSLLQSFVVEAIGAVVFDGR